MTHDSSYSEHLLECAKYYRSSEPAISAVPDLFEDEDHLFSTMRDIILFDAHHALQEKIDQPTKCVLNGVDLDTEEPGIQQGESVQRGNPAITPMTYRRVVSTTVPQVVTEKQLSEAQITKLTRAAQLRTEKKTEEDEAKAAYSLMSPEGKQRERTKVQQSKREKREEREEKKRGENMKTEDSTSENAAPCSAEDAPVDAKKNTKHLMVDQADRVILPQDTTRRLRQRKDVMHYFQSPASHDRHLLALTRLGLSSEIKKTILEGTVSENVVIIDGPPGTGKTTSLLDRLEVWLHANPGQRALVCAPTNIGAADLFSRALTRKLYGGLSLSRQHMPIGVPVLRGVDLVSTRIIFCTVAGRASPTLLQQEFASVFLDEAAHVIEAHANGLLRPAVSFVCMAGDLAQLPAMLTRQAEKIGGARSLMERLRTNGVPETQLTVQYRMHPQILEFPNTHFYGGRLRTASDRETKSLPEGMLPYALISVPTGTERSLGTSYENEEEASVAVSVAKSLRAMGLETVLLTAYQGQVTRLQSIASGIVVHTIDSFQGKECDAVVISVTRTEAAGFWEDSRRLTVALTRARHVLRLCINANKWRDADQTSPLGILVRDAASRNVLI